MASKQRTTVTIETRQRTVIRRRRGQTVAWCKQCRDAPDTDDGGYQFWLAKLNQFNGNFIAAQMVRAFLLSTEYRQRFGQP